MTHTPSKPRHLIVVCAAGVLVVLSGWAALDLFGKRTRNLRDFDPGDVARLDTAVWRSSKQRLRLFFQLTELLRKEYRLPWLRSQWVGYQAAKAAFVFKEDFWPRPQP